MSLRAAQGARWPVSTPALRSSRFPLISSKTISAIGPARDRFGFTALNAGKSDDFLPEAGNDGEEQTEVLVKDPDNGKTIECYIDQELSVDGKTYFLVYPCDRPVVLAYVDKDGEEEELNPVPDDDVAKIFPAAYKACAAEDVELVNSAVVLTLQGDLEDDDDEGDVDYGDLEDDQELVKVITSFTEAGVEYLVTEPLDPVLIVVKQVDGKKKKSDRDEFLLLSDAELEKVMPSVNAILESQIEEEEEDSRG